MYILAILLQAKTSTTNTLIPNLILIAGILLVFYLFMILPQQRRQREQAKFKESLKKGDSVITIGGLYGKIYSIQDDTITLEVDKGVKLTFDRSSVSMEYTKKIKAQKSTES